MSPVQRDSILLLTTFLVAHLFMYYAWGIVTELEAEKYIRQAELMLNGNPFDAPKYLHYLPIILLIAAARSLAFGYAFVAVVQSIFSAFAMLLFYRGAQLLAGRLTAFIAAMVLCLFLPYFAWDLALYSESIFISLGLILFYFVCRDVTFGGLNSLMVFGLVGAMIFTRPFGVLFIPPVFVYFLLKRYRKPSDRMLTLSLATGFTFMMFLLINSIFKGGGDMDAMKPFVEEHIICFVPMKPQGASLKLKYFDNGIRDIAYYVVHNPIHFLKLVTARLFSFFSMTRPWYSPIHNFAIRMFTIPVYLFFLVGLWYKAKQWNPAFTYMLALLVLYPVAVTFQCDDWHARFTMPILPCIVFFAACGITTWYQKWKGQTSN